MTGRFQHPFHCVQFVERQSKGLQDLLIASAGPKIYSYAARDGRRLAVWPQDGPGNTQEPPEKKRRVSGSDVPESEGDVKSAEEETGKVPATIEWSNVPLLVTSSDGAHVVALTGEDKCIRVLSVGENGTLEQLCARYGDAPLFEWTTSGRNMLTIQNRHMPKRPSAIALANDDSVILCGDKFGDVYALPLIPGETSSSLQSRSAANVRPNQPAATSLTVHSKRNRQALEQQKRQWSQGEWKTEEKSGPPFEHQVILGHVSLLTDLIYISLPSDGSSGSKRSYILTGDRDEHIRVSRGPPQAHIIESFCQGHTSFISKLCIPHWNPEYLVSGGGDNYLLVWSWKEGRIIQKIPLVDQSAEATEVAVRGIWAASLATEGSAENLKVILVAIEGSAQLQCFVLEAAGTLNAQAPIQLSGNALDLASMEATGDLVVSVDCVREPESTQQWKTTPASPQTLLESFHVKAGPATLEWNPVHEMTTTVNSEGTSDLTAPAEGKQRQELDESLYSMGNLRKKTTYEEE